MIITDKGDPLTLELNLFSTTMNIVPTPMNYANKITYRPKPKPLNQPMRLWHNRYLKDGIKKSFTNIQAEGIRQRTPLKIKVIEKF